MEHKVDVKKLHATDDAMVWAEEFVALFKSGVVVDEGLMVGWFANSIETARILQAADYTETYNMGYKDGWTDGLHAG